MTSGRQLCPRCNADFEAVVFRPPQRRSLRVAEVGAAGPGGDTSCAVHKRNAAVANCSRCGIFICSLCKVEADRRVFCPACFERLADEDALDTTRTKYRDWSTLGLAFALLGIPFFFLGVGLGAAAFYCGIKAARQREERGDSVGLVAIYSASVLGALEIAGGAIFLVSLFR
jgi:hypothetical protein